MKFRVFRIRRTINDVYLSGTINKVYVIFQLNLQLLYPSAKLMQKKLSFVSVKVLIKPTYDRRLKFEFIQEFFHIDVKY